MNSIRNEILLLVLLVMIGSVVLANYIARNTARPLLELSKELSIIGKNNFTGVFKVSGWEEINQIRDECNYMLKRIELLLDDVKTNEKEKRLAEIGFMQIQMNPHFVYNTLFSIKCLVDMENKEKALGSIDAFTAILKNVLSYSDEYILIKDEIQLLQDYVKLQKYRYGDVFDFKIDCEEELYCYKILRMLIQPIIENAIFHGVVENDIRGVIELRIKKENDKLLVTVADNGCGIKQEDIKNILTKKYAKKSESSNLIGIQNIAHRIRLCFGNEYRLEIESEIGKGTTVSFQVPCIK